MFVYCDGQLSSNKEGYKNEIKNFIIFKMSFSFICLLGLKNFLEGYDTCKSREGRSQR